jgi:hypothetical protein
MGRSGMQGQDMATHEAAGHDGPMKAGSDRVFGLVFAALFALVGLAPLLHGRPFRLWAVILCVAFLACALLLPITLRPLNLVWFRLGLVLHKITSPLVMGLLFFGTITPMAWLLRRRGTQPINTTMHPEAPSYWVVRTPPGPAPQSLSQQF